MRTVFKYPLPVNDHPEVGLPEGAKILSVDNQHGKPMIWALVNPDAPLEFRRFRFVGTGHPIVEPPERLKHIGTFQMDNGTFVWHIFEIV